MVGEIRAQEQATKKSAKAELNPDDNPNAIVCTVSPCFIDWESKRKIEYSEKNSAEMMT